MDKVILKVKGTTYSGWKSVQVHKSIEQLAGSFSFSAADRFPGKMADWKIKEQDECTVEVVVPSKKNQILITGYIDNISIDYDSEGHTINISGREKTHDLVDCSYTGPSEFKEQTVEDLITELCSPFSIPITIDSGVQSVVAEKVPSFVPDQGAIVFDLITKLTKLKAILPIGYGNGRLTLARAGTKQTVDSLELGVNVKRGGLSTSCQDRFSNYIVKTQDSGTDDLGLLEIVQPAGQAVDKLVQRHRPLIILAEGELTTKSARARAVWESKRRAAQSQRYIYTVFDWVQSDGTIWGINSLVQIKDSFLDFNGTKLIVALTFVLNEGEGTVTNIEIIDKGAFDLFETPVEEVKTNFSPAQKAVAEIPIVQLPTGIFETGQ